MVAKSGRSACARARATGVLWLGALALIACSSASKRAHDAGKGGQAQAQPAANTRDGGAPREAGATAPAAMAMAMDASHASAGNTAARMAAGTHDAASAPATQPADAAPSAGEDADMGMLLADAAIAVPAPSPSGCITDVSSGHHEELPCDGITHNLTVPEACLHTQCGLILDVHGGTMNARMEDNNTRMSALGERDGYVVIQPNAANGLFDASTDDAKVYAFAQTAIAVFHLDEKRVHMTGFSQGGYMTWRFICQHSDFLASAAPAASSGAANISDEVDCSFTGSDRPSRELPILYMHGRRDALVDYQNGVTKAENVRAAFSLSAPEKIEGDDTYDRVRSTNANGTVFEFISHNYASDSSFPLPPPLGIAIEGHCYPGSTDLTPTEPGQLMAFGCVPPTSFTWGETVIAFFHAHPKR